MSTQGVWITKTGFRATEWDGEIREYVDKPIKSIFHEMKSTCHIEDGVTLGDIIKIVGTNKKLSDFIGDYAWADVQAFYKEVLKPTTKKSELKFIELSKSVEINNIYEAVSSDHNAGDIYNSIDVHGRDDSETTWGIELTPVNEMADVPVKLDGTLEVYDMRNLDPKEGYKTLAKGTCYFSLLEVLGEIFWEISFMGSPDNRDELADNLHRAADEIKSGKAKLTPVKELKEKKEKVN